MAKKGCNASFLLGTDVVAELNNVSNSITGETLDTTTFDSACTREFIAGLKSGTIDVSGYYDPDDTTGQVALMTALLNGTVLTTTQKPKILWNGTNGITADALVSTFNMDTTVEALVNFSATLQLTGTIAIV